MVRSLTNNGKWFLLSVASKVDNFACFLPSKCFECNSLCFFLLFIRFDGPVTVGTPGTSVHQTEPGV